MNDEVQVYSITDEYMKNNYVKTLPYELIENLIYFLCAYPIAAMINNILNKNEKMLYLNLLTIIPIFLMTYLRVKVKTMRKFILGIVLVISIALSIGFVLKQYIFMGLLIFWAIDCIKRSTSKQRVGFNKFNLLIVESLLIPQIIIAAVADLKAFQVLAAIISFVIMIISIGYICKARNVRLSMDDAENESFNKKDNNIFIAGTLILIAMIVFILYNLGTFDVAYDLTRKFADFLINIGKGNANNHSKDIQNFISKNSDINIGGINNNSAETPSKLYELISNILNVIFNAIGIVIIIIISYLLINRILIYIKKLRNKDKITFVYSSHKEGEFKKKVNKIRYNIRKSIFLNDKEKIRKLYKDKVLKYKKNNIKVNNFFSTNEIQKEILSKAFDNIEDITRVYEKARYSNEKITKDDVETLKHKMK